jgi:hypothetical protein
VSVMEIEITDDAELNRIRHACVQYTGLRESCFGFHPNKQATAVSVMEFLNRLHEFIISCIRAVRFTVIRHAIFGLDTWRFAAMFGEQLHLPSRTIHTIQQLFP